MFSNQLDNDNIVSCIHAVIQIDKRKKKWFDNILTDWNEWMNISYKILEVRKIDTVEIIFVQIDWYLKFVWVMWVDLRMENFCEFLSFIKIKSKMEFLRFLVSFTTILFLSLSWLIYFRFYTTAESPLPATKTNQILKLSPKSISKLHNQRHTKNLSQTWLQLLILQLLNTNEIHMLWYSIWICNMTKKRIY